MSSPRRDDYRHPFVQQIVSALRRRCGVSPGERVLLAVSGGADSVALLRAMAVIAPRRPWRLSLAVGHVNHHLRDDAELDAQLVAELADSLGLPFYLQNVFPAEQVDNEEENGEPARNIEARARSMRYNALTCIAAEIEADFVATAHHGDDQLETLLMRMMRGSSVKGMSGIRWRRRLPPPPDAPPDPAPPPDAAASAFLIRPMLLVSHQDAANYLNHLGQTWREDHTNADPTRTRARLRQDVLPTLNAMFPRGAASAQRFAEQQQQLADWLGREVEKAIGDPQTVRHFDSDAGAERFVLARAKARELPAPVCAALIKRLLVDAGVSGDQLPHRVIHQMASAVRDTQGGRRQFVLSDHLVAELTRDNLSGRMMRD